MLPWKMMRPLVHRRWTALLPPKTLEETVKRLSSMPSTESPDPELIKCLESHGVSKEIGAGMLSQLPPFHVPNEIQLDQVMNAWNSCQFGQETLSHILATNPGYLLLEPQQITEYFVFLSSLFTHKYVYKVLINAPQVFDQRRSEISSKLDFTRNVLKVSNADVVNSPVLNYPLSHLRLRFEFLKRSGAYKVGKDGERSSSNPTLVNMFCTSEKDFVQKVARLSLIEMEAFKTLYELECSDLEEDSDSD